MPLGHLYIKLHNECNLMQMCILNEFHPDNTIYSYKCYSKFKPMVWTINVLWDIGADRDLIKIHVPGHQFHLLINYWLKSKIEKYEQWMPNY